MLLQKITPRKVISLSVDSRLYSHSALTITMEQRCEREEGVSYHATYTEIELLEMLSIINKRKEEIKLLNKKD